MPLSFMLVLQGYVDYVDIACRLWLPLDSTAIWYVAHLLKLMTMASYRVLASRYIRCFALWQP